MRRCIRDKGRFAKHRFDISFLEAVNKNIDYMTCIRCGLKRFITALMKVAAKMKPQLEIYEILPENNEIVENAEFVKAK